jgi:hypothetical protein
MGRCKEMVFGEIISIKNMWEVGRIIKLMDMEFIQLRKVIIKVYKIIFRLIF